ncbi:DLW-39 family protein [Nocardia tengchongensis]|uniref:DLW-39 family protein n=1 Tax=Nocardia tengchongensis TaxID=2055889 RepID=A0ABX8CSS2_9NOCA|nr:DLW-39 family protein [Nocardia tengchongensis]QVI22589.1 DLW-39 family protein [Nocardia tengchongensis]
MKFVLTIVAIAAVAFGISKLRQRNDADLWHEVTTR